MDDDQITDRANPEASFSIQIGNTGSEYCRIAVDITASRRFSNADRTFGVKAKYPLNLAFWLRLSIPLRQAAICEKPLINRL